MRTRRYAVFRAVFLAAGVNLLAFLLRAGDCEASYDCGGHHGAYGSIRCVCRDVDNRVECIFCNTNNPCAGECLSCCSKNRVTGQIGCNRATCSRNVWCQSGCGVLLSNSSSEFPRHAARTAAGVAAGCPCSVGRRLSHRTASTSSPWRVPIHSSFRIRPCFSTNARRLSASNSHWGTGASRR